ncbi:unnamed protein product [Cuscuta campestris]|uniref:Reverse transcriptase domain-containing protein n=1 Tax=Cuscuta campestris TaxID=132261 RepID=A0A484LB21_9ASTE|nr:unnamed protein product [Cuscuta campestris]
MAKAFASPCKAVVSSIFHVPAAMKVPSPLRRTALATPERKQFVMKTALEEGDFWNLLHVPIDLDMLEWFCILFLFLRLDCQISSASLSISFCLVLFLRMLPKAVLADVSNREYHFWKQKCSLKWFKEGDANTKFFHGLVKEKRRKQRINVLMNENGEAIQDTCSLEDMVVHHFSTLFNGTEQAATQDMYNDFMASIPHLINNEQNTKLMALPSEQELKDILWGMDANSCAGPDGFNVTFFKGCWDIVKRDVTSACQEVFLGIPMTTAAASSNICLLPKVVNANKLNYFRPICLSTIASKIATRCIAKRLGRILPEIISEEQAAYVPGREMLDQILITKELVHNINKKTKGGNLIIKLDLSKAFDKVKWSYLLDILQRFGFCPQFIHMIENLLITKLEKIMNMSHKKFPFIHLGTPIDLGITRAGHCAGLIQSFDSKLNGWYQRSLDHAGRLVLINHVLNTIPNYFLGTNTIPTSICNMLEQKMAHFWWGGGTKHHWTKWEDLCLPKEEGGIGTRRLKTLEAAFSLKLWWKVHHENSIWARFMRAKYWREVNAYKLIDKISTYIRQWLLVKTPNKIQTHDAWLFTMKIIPQFTKEKQVRIIKWMAPPTGRLKLNVDASFTISNQRGAAILRDENGRFVRAATFSLASRTPFQAEVAAGIEAIS